MRKERRTGATFPTAMDGRDSVRSRFSDKAPYPIAFFENRSVARDTESESARLRIVSVVDQSQLARVSFAERYVLSRLGRTAIVRRIRVFWSSIGLRKLSRQEVEIDSFAESILARHADFFVPETSERLLRTSLNDTRAAVEAARTHNFFGLDLAREPVSRSLAAVHWRSNSTKVTRQSRWRT